MTDKTKFENVLNPPDENTPFDPVEHVARLAEDNKLDVDDAVDSFSSLAEVIKNIQDFIVSIEDRLVYLEKVASALPFKYHTKARQTFYSEDGQTEAWVKYMLEFVTKHNKEHLRPVKMQTLSGRFARVMLISGSKTPFPMTIDGLELNKKLVIWTAKSGARWVWTDEGYDFAIENPKFKSTELIKELHILPTTDQMQEVKSLDTSRLTREEVLEAQRKRKSGQDSNS